jgi:hypothetical protein
VLITNGMTTVRTTDVRLVGVPIVHRAEDIHSTSAMRYLEASVSDPPDMRVVIASGKVVIDDVYVAYAGGTTSAFTAPVSNPRIDLVALNSAGSLVVVAGTEAASPSRPSAKGVLPICFVSLAVGQTKIVDANLADARPFLRANTSTRRYHQATATSGQTVFSLPWSYSVGAHALTITQNGAVLAETEYTETSATSITLASGAVLSDVLTFTALESAPLETVALAQVTDSLSGLMVPEKPDLTVEDFGSGVQVAVAPITRLILANIAYADTGGETITPSGLSANTWYYLYAYASGSALAYTLSTAPDGGRVWRSGGTTHRFLGSVRAGSGGTPVVARKVGDVVLYQRSLLGATALDVYTCTANTWDTVDLSAFVPPHARQVLVEIEVQASATNNAGAELRTYGGTTGGILTLLVPTHGTDAQKGHREAWVVCDASQRLQVQRPSGYAGTVVVRALGYRE